VDTFTKIHVLKAILAIVANKKGKEKFGGGVSSEGKGFLGNGVKMFFWRVKRGVQHIGKPSSS